MNDDRSDLGRTVDRSSWIRTGSVFVRAVHLVAASAVAGAYLLGDGVSAGHTWWAVAGLSGVLLLVAEGLRHRDLYRETAGLATIGKLALIGALFLVPDAGPCLMGAAVVVAGIGAHAPRRWRHRRLY